MAVMDPELEDAQRLNDELPPDLAAALARAKSTLPGEAGQAALSNDLMNVQVRHQLIIRLRAQGMLEDRIARAVGVSLRTVQRVVTGYWQKKREELNQQDLDNLVLLIAEGYLEDVDRLTDVVRKSSHASAIVGAIKARQEARQKYVDLLADFGFLKRKAHEVDVNVSGMETNQNVIVVNQDVLRRYADDLLDEKRMLKVGGADAPIDEDLEDFVVINESDGQSDPS